MRSDARRVQTGELQLFNDVASKTVLAHPADRTDTESEFSQLATKDRGGASHFQRIIANELLDLLELRAHIPRHNQIATRIAGNHHVEFSGWSWNLQNPPRCWWLRPTSLEQVAAAVISERFRNPLVRDWPDCCQSGRPLGGVKDR